MCRKHVQKNVLEETLKSVIRDFGVMFVVCVLHTGFYLMCEILTQFIVLDVSHATCSEKCVQEIAKLT